MSTDPALSAGNVSPHKLPKGDGVNPSELFSETQTQKEALYRLTDRLQHARSLGEIYAAGIEAILRGVRCQRASLLLADDERVMRFVASHGLSSTYQRAVEGHSPWQPDEQDPSPVCIEDVTRENLGPELTKVISAERIAALGFFPLVSSRGLIGKFMTYYDAPHSFSIGDIETSLTIARQLATAIDRWQTDLALRAELADTQLLHRLSGELIDQQNVESLYEKLVDAAATLMRSDLASMQMLVPGSGGQDELQLLAFRGFPPEAVLYWKRVTVSSASNCGVSLRANGRTVVADIELAGLAADSAELAMYRRSGIRSVQSTPLVSRSGKLVGMISTQWRVPHTPSARDLRLFDLLARQAADLIERRRASDELSGLKDRLAEEVNELIRLHEFSTRLMQLKDVSTVLRELLTAACNLMRVEEGSVQLYDRVHGALKLIGTAGLPAEFETTFRLVDARGFTTCAEALRTTRRVIVEDLWDNPAWTQLATVAREYGLRSAQSTSILDASGSVAAVLTTYCAQVHRPSERNLRLLDLYCEVAGRQIDRYRAEEALRFLADLSAALTAVASLQDIARVTSEKVRGYFGPSHIVFSQVAAGTDEVILIHSDAPPTASTALAHRLSQHLGEATVFQLQAGRTIAVEDVSADTRAAAHARAYSASSRSFVLVPHVSHGRWKFLLAIYKDAPFRWTPRDLELVGEVAARVHLRLERAHAENELAQSEAKLRQDDRRKDEFLAMLAHELRNPLAPIANAVQLLGKSRANDPVQQQVRAIIERQTDRLSRLVDDLLEVSRITSGRIQLHREDIDLRGVAERVVEAVRPLIDERRHTLRLDLPADPIWVHADAIRLEQVLVNLLNNAAKYTDDGGTIHLTVAVEYGQAVVRVADNGIGIERELLPSIFELFTQAERSLDRSGGGLGIGLSLVDRLVRLHGGRVSVESTVGQGSVFSVQLPVVAAPRCKPIQPSLPRTGESRALRILVVDDNVDAAQSFAMLLEMSGHEVRVAHDGRAALAVADAHRPALIFLDIGLPQLNGYDVAHALRKNPLHATAVLVAMTGYGQTADRERALAAGFDHHLVKPVDFDKVSSLVSTVVVPKDTQGLPQPVSP